MRVTSRLTYANVASTLALVVALGGGGAAVAAGLAKNSVGSKQIKAGAVKSSDLGADAVDSSKVEANSLTGADIKESTLVLPGARATAVPGLPFRDESAFLVEGDNPAGTAQLTAPTAGKVLVTWSGSFSAAQAGHFIDAALDLDGVEVGGTWMDPGDVDDSFDQEQSLTALVPVTPGSHTFTVTLAEHLVTADEYSSYTGGDLVLLFVPD